MKNNKQNLSLLTPDQREIAIKKIINYFATQKEEQIGVIAAEDLLTMFLESVGPNIYNLGVKEAKNLFEENFQNTLFNLELLTKQKDKE